jgi:uncharacterized protein (DUF1501 family)/uncharacterized protein (DUF1800 family)
MSSSRSVAPSLQLEQNPISPHGAAVGMRQSLREYANSWDVRAHFEVETDLDAKKDVSPKRFKAVRVQAIGAFCALCAVVGIVIGVITLRPRKQNGGSGGSNATSSDGGGSIKLPVFTGFPYNLPAQASATPLPHSSKNTLLLLKRLEGVAGKTTTVARSYDGYNWESVQPQPLQPDCSGQTVQHGKGFSNCVIVPGISTQYRVERLVYEGQIDEAKFDAARLLRQATFGPTRGSFKKFLSSHPNSGTTASAMVAVDGWINKQMSLPVTSLRKHVRERINPRIEQTSSTGGIRTQCQIGSRWHRFAFTEADRFKRLVVSAVEIPGVYTIRIDGSLRTEVTTWNNVQWSASLGSIADMNVSTYLLCPTIHHSLTVGTLKLAKLVGAASDVSRVLEGKNPHTCSGPDKAPSFTYFDKNPALSFTSLDVATTNVYTSAEAHVTPIPSADDAFVLDYLSNPNLCDRGKSEGGHYHSLMKLGNIYYRFDPRMRLVENTLESPFNMSKFNTGQGADNKFVCPSVAKTFLNKRSCKRVASCSPTAFTSAAVALNESNIVHWYSKSGKHLHYITGLKLEGGSAISPCTERHSRWRRMVGGCSTPTVMDEGTRATLVRGIRDSSDSANVYVRDIDLVESGERENCTTTGTRGAYVEVDGVCWEHVHPNLYGVYDFTRWTQLHPGNDAAENAGRPNPIMKFSVDGQAKFIYPSWHPMSRWLDNVKKKNIVYVGGRLGDIIDFRIMPTDVQTPEMAAYFSAIATGGGEGGGDFETCGSPDEVANIPIRGHKYFMNREKIKVNVAARSLDRPHNVNQGKQMAWYTLSVASGDQLRMRMAWALAQIITLGENGVGRASEVGAWTAWYDIFVRHAFGNYQDLLKEVSYHPFMGLYLTYRQNKAFSISGAFPDENYAREIMQLFTIGLWELEVDGTETRGIDGERIHTYTNDDVVAFARIWTGFDRRPFRGNLQDMPQDVNDPMVLKPLWRDGFPKTKLKKTGYIGDAFPICNELPPQHFLRKGARFVYSGKVSLEKLEDPAGRGYANAFQRGRFAPSPASSKLYQALCQRTNGPTSPCRFPGEVILTSNIPCHGSQECNAEDIRTVQMVDGNVTVYYSYKKIPCVRLTMFNEGQVTKYSSQQQCSNVHSPVAGAACCMQSNKKVISTVDYGAQCLFTGDKMTAATAQSRCKGLGSQLCENFWLSSVSTQYKKACAYGQFAWLSRTCSLQVQVDTFGLVNLIDPVSTENKYKLNSESKFGVIWNRGAFPIVTSTPPCQPNAYTNLECVPGGLKTCVCNVTVDTKPVFVDIPTLVEAKTRLFIGAPLPTSFDPGAYSVCTTFACSRANDGVVAYLKTGSGIASMDTIFELPPNVRGGSKVYLYNKVSSVWVGGKPRSVGNSDSGFSFRNPPHFNPLVGEKVSQHGSGNTFTDIFHIDDAQHETDALLDHLVEHQNTPVFVSTRLIKRFVTSNPSPRYLKSVSDAFRTGTYAGSSRKFSGKYGDLGATLAAVLLDQEARAITVELDPAHGRLREPLLKLMHLMRSLEFKPVSEAKSEISMPYMFGKIGQEPFNPPSVFGFYLAEYSPPGPLGTAELLSAEAQIYTSPLIIGYLNGMSSLINNGLTACDKGFGGSYIGISEHQCGSFTKVSTADGELTFKPANISGADPSPNEIIDELDWLLTGGRLAPRNRKVMLDAYTNSLSSSSKGNALKVLFKLFMMTAEFHATNWNSGKNVNRLTEPTQVSLGRKYKALVILFLAGGADSFNMLVPHSNCVDSENLYDNYVTARGGAALQKGTLHTIQVPVPGTQPCDTFGLHNKLPQLKSLYDAGEAIVLPNIGALVEPVNVEQYKSKSKRLPPSLFAHNIMQRSMHNLHAQSASSTGVLGRITNALTQKAAPYKTRMYSLMGNVKIVEGSSSPEMINGRHGIVRFSELSNFEAAIANLTKEKSESFFAETFSSVLETSLLQTEQMGAMLDNVELNTTFPESDLGGQFDKVAKVIKLNKNVLEMERAAFVTKLGGFDTHNSFDTVTGDVKFDQINGAISSFVEEMKAQSAWDDVAVLTVSDFGRTISSNGLGTDHGWGGNMVLLGGGVDGGKFMGKFPHKLGDDGELNIGRGRVIPSTSWEAVWKGLAEWLDVPADKLDEVLPNLKNFPPDQVFGKAQLFK